jgi:excinuclease ABC subunit B
MGPGPDAGIPANAVPRSLFKKQTAAEAHGSDYGMPDDGKSLFRKNSLDEMTVRRTEKPVEGKAPAKPQPISPQVGEMAGRTQGGAKDRGASASPHGEPVEPRGRPGAGSYEDPAEARRQKRRPGKTGRPGN